MKKVYFLHVGAIVAAVAAVSPLGACSDLSAQCTSANVKPGGSCSNDSLQCAYSFDQPNCDGTSSTIASSCVCQSGTWSCPSPADCQNPTDDAGDDGATGDDSATGDDGASDGAIDDGNTGSDAPADVAADVGCNTPDIPCNGVCVNPLTDKNNCSSCGHKCVGNQTCSNGSCI